MKTKVIMWFFSLIFLVPWCAQGQTVTAERVNKAARGRYMTDKDFRFGQVEFSQPDYKFESALPEGFGRATAAELGVAGKHFWNEYPGQGAALVVMAPDTVLIYDTVSRQPLYVTGCYREGRVDGLNRLKGLNRIQGMEVPEPPMPPLPFVQIPPQLVELILPPLPVWVELTELPPAPAQPVLPPQPKPLEPERKRRDILKYIPCVGLIAHPTKGRAIYCGVVVGAAVGIGFAAGGGAAVGFKTAVTTISPP